ncbi:MAG TPA: hypothetical protein DCL41_06590 [Bdellovibrionales bacterium]|nr:hypothetical protein [Pseudobdellovibrionaceae bacterium]HAG91519.1 hypothetical protein [Bdellovibrionales bacterium]|tara:strand:- start:5490 stop:5717 length:228 start_codon:yes stop_codon:yes gene_type:complete
MKFSVFLSVIASLGVLLSKGAKLNFQTSPADEATKDQKDSASEKVNFESVIQNIESDKFAKEHQILVAKSFTVSK